MNIYKRMSVKAKIMGCSGILLVLMGACSFYAYQSISSIGREIAAIAEKNMPITEKLTAATIGQLEQAILFERALRYGMQMQHDPAADEYFKESRAAFDGKTRYVEDRLHEAGALAVSDGGAEQEAKFAKVARSVKAISTEHLSYVKHAEQILARIAQRNFDIDYEEVERIEKEEAKLDKEMETLLLEIEHFTRTAAEDAETHELAVAKTLSVVALISLIVGLSLSIVIANFIVSAIRKATVTASGDLTQAIEVDSQDEIGELLTAMNGMRLKLLGMLEKISGTTEQLSAASEEMSAVTAQTGRIIEQQRSETEQVATAMNEMTATVQEVTQNINHTASAASEANEHALNGRRVVDKSVAEINQLAEQIEQASVTVHELEQQSEGINAVLDVIKSIAEQTNLLALNAAIEAARAGEQGRGFAVVADEVRTLAGRTQESTEEINLMIEKLQSGSQRAVQVMEQSREKARSVVSNAAESGHALSTIAEAVAKIDDMSTQIASASEEQSAVSEEINRNIVKINEMATETASGAEQTSVASQDLARMATELQGIVSQFNR